MTRFCLAAVRVTTVDRVKLASALFVVALVACTGPAPAPSASPAPAVRGALRNVILQAADMPADYVVEKDEEMTPDDLANGLGATQADLKQRLAVGYVRTFIKNGDPFVCCAIDSILISTADEGAAVATANTKASALPVILITVLNFTNINSASVSGLSIRVYESRP